MITVGGVAAAGTGNQRERLSHQRLIGRRIEKRINPAQRIQVVRDVEEPGRVRLFLEDAKHTLGGHHLTQIAQVDLTGGRNSRGQDFSLCRRRQRIHQFICPVSHVSP